MPNNLMTRKLHFPHCQTWKNCCPWAATLEVSFRLVACQRRDVPSAAALSPRRAGWSGGTIEPSKISIIDFKLPHPPSLQQLTVFAAPLYHRSLQVQSKKFSH